MSALDGKSKPNQNEAAKKVFGVLLFPFILLLAGALIILFLVYVNLIEDEEDDEDEILERRG